MNQIQNTSQSWLKTAVQNICAFALILFFVLFFCFFALRSCEQQAQLNESQAYSYEKLMKAKGAAQ